MLQSCLAFDPSRPQWGPRLALASRPRDAELRYAVDQIRVEIELGTRRVFARCTAGTLVLTRDELVVVCGPPEAPRVFMRQGRSDLAMVRRPTARGGERVELAALDGQQATLRFGRADVGAAQVLAGWLAGLSVTG